MEGGACHACTAGGVRHGLANRSTVIHIFKAEGVPEHTKGRCSKLLLLVCCSTHPWMHAGVIASFAAGTPFVLEILLPYIVTRAYDFDSIAHLLRMPASTCHLLALDLHSQMFSLLAFRCNLAMTAVNYKPHELPRHTLVLATHYTSTVLYLTRTPYKKQTVEIVEWLMRLMNFFAIER